MKFSSPLPLGQKSEYISKYDPELLCPIKRVSVRMQINTQENTTKGYDIWNCYEVSWLNLKGKPEVRILTFIISANSENIVESKSVKLYLNSFTNTKFLNEAEVLHLIKKDLSTATRSDIWASLSPLETYINQSLTLFEGTNIDHLDIEIEDFVLDKNLLKLSGKNNLVKETLCSNLLKSNCPVTKQPDWASIQIHYLGLEIDHASLLKYLLGFRNHNGFHEQCVEQIFTNILEVCHPSELTVYARYTRRGGIDINSIRSSRDLIVTEINNLRQVRQ